MGQYLPKRSNVEAHQLKHDNADDLARLCGGVVVEERDPETNKRFPGINVPTLKGMKRLGFEDYLVQDANSGAWSVVRKHGFEAAYSEAEDG